MPELTLYIGNKNYSSWSLRAWLTIKRAGVPFREHVFDLSSPDVRQAIRRHSPSGRVPALVHGNLKVHDSLAICEYLAETCPDAALWPVDAAARALARSVSNEMHSGFAALRTRMPMNVRRACPGKGRADGVSEDIDRITAIWRDCRERFGGAGGFLFGEWSIADAMFAPVVSRFRTYRVDVDRVAAAYMDAVWALPAMQEWKQAAEAEPMTLAVYDL
jgi:glutathione S-transferase